MQLSQHFSLREFIVSDAAEAIGDDNLPTPAHLENLRRTAAGFEAVRSILGDRVIVITSGYRNPRVNRAVKGTPTSAHPLGFAGDFRVAELTPLMCARRLEAAMREGRLQFDQLILETSRAIVHLSFDPRNRCQVKTQAAGAGTLIVKGLPDN